MSGQVTSPFQSNLSFVSNHLQTPISPSNRNRQEKWDPRPSHEQPAKQEAHQCISIRDPLRSYLVESQNKFWKTKEILQVNKEQLQAIENPLALTQYYKDLIQHHVAMRVALFFQQAVICYNTPFHFEIANTDGQFFQAPTLKASDGNQETSVKYQAAHSSTIPALQACLRSDFVHYNSVGIQPPYFSFLKDSHLENLDNSTVGLPVFVNKVDTLIDGQSGCKTGLRYDAIKLINRVAKAKLTPIQATQQFLHRFSQKLQTRPQHSKRLTPEKLAVINLYKEKVNEMITLASFPLNIQGRHPFFDSLLDVNVINENPTDVPLIRDIVFKKKFEIIREAQFAESKIHEIINNNHPNWSAENKHFAKLSLVYQVRNDIPLRQALEKLFCISVDRIEQNLQLCSNLTNHYIQNATIYNNILDNIRAVLQHFQKMEQSFQAMLLKSIRKELRGLNQEELSNEVIRVIANRILAEEQKPQRNQEEIDYLRFIPTSVSTISRLENSRIHIIKTFKTPENQRRKVLTLRYAQILCEALRIQSGYFFCSFFASKNS